MILYGPDGKPLPEEAFRSPIDFGPGLGIQPRITAMPYPPREYQYVPGYNLLPTPRGEQPGKRFADLRLYASLCSYARIAISYRKNQATGLEWNIVPGEDAASPELREKYGDEIEELEKFFKEPNRIDGITMHQWLKQAIEEILVTDALVFFVHPRRDGKPHSYVQIDGATIKLMIDQFAHIVGYQQILYGYPATYYPMNLPDGEAGEPKSGALRYIQHNPNVHSTYGTSPLEEIAPIIDTAIRRQLFHLNWYNEGSVPTAFIEAPAGWTQSQIAELQGYYDRLLGGSDRERHKLRVVPANSKITPMKAFEFSKDENDALLSAVIAHFGVPRHLFISETNRATAQINSDDTVDIGSRPLWAFLADMITDWIHNDFGLPELEFRWKLKDPPSIELLRAQARTAYVTAGILTEDEVRKELGYDPMPEAEKAKRPLPAAAGALPPGNASGKDQAQREGTAPPKDDQAGAGESATADQVKAELAQWQRFALRRLEKGRQADPFTTTIVPIDTRRFIFRGLLEARDADATKAIFAEAWDQIEKKDFPKETREIAEIVHRLFRRQKRSALKYAREALG